MFKNIRNAGDLGEVRNLLQTEASPYWHTHHTFGRVCAPVSRRTSTRFTDLLILNTVIPVLLAYSRKTGQFTSDRFINWAGELKAEDNRVVREFKQEGICVNNAQESQALLQLYNRYCLKNKCLQCRWGIYLLYGKY
ncbi:hypothetical protein GCM10011361_08870 [Muriicola marianensis]|uniref:Uncharacterized protein n=1 Tax=Muriicola marianensis TaxID=1324801 RepID=A0ABQ1QSL9_9FLAO|nr:hypothetical protein GCM10011361_08870 [Muriicola marianensis]